MANLNVLQLIPLYLKYSTKIQNAWNIATSNKDFLDIVEREIPVIADLGDSIVGDIAPQSEPIVRQAIATALTFNHTLVTWGQRAVNAAADAGLIKIAAPLDVDGFWGPKSAAGFKALQDYAIAQGFSLSADGFLGKVSEAIIKQLNIPGLQPMPAP